MARKQNARPAHTEEQLAVWRARFGFQVFGVVALLIVFGLILTGLMLGFFEQDPFDRGPDSPGNWVFRNHDLIAAYHHYAGYVLMLCLPAAGLFLALLGKRLGGKLRSVLRPLGLAIAVIGFSASAFAHITGSASGSVDEPIALDPHGEATGTADLDSLDLSASFGRRGTAVDMYALHTHEAAWLQVPAILFLMVGAAVVSGRNIKIRAGIVKDADPKA